MANHLTIGIYPNGDWKYNVVSDTDLEQHIEYNRLWRCGRLLYVDGVRVNDGCMKPDALAFYDALERQVRSSLLGSVNMNKLTLPYR